MKIERIGGKFSHHTYDIQPIRDLLKEEMTDKLSIDPFGTAGSPALVSNEFANDRSACHNWDAITFLRLFDKSSVDGVLYNPPYSPAMIEAYYAGHGFKRPSSRHGWASLWYHCKNEIARILKPGGKCISFGWNSTGCGEKRGFKLERILIVPHGQSRNDTICTVETKIKRRNG